MLKTKKRKIITGILLVLIIMVGTMGANYYPFLLMKPVKTGKIEGMNIVAVQNSINSLYFVECGDGYILIDCGSNLAKIKTTMEEQGIEPAEVMDVFLTHTDSDHVAALKLFKHANIYMSEDEKAMLTGEVKRNFMQYNSLDKEVNIEEVKLLTEEESIIIGDTQVTAIKTPGHTVGSMSYIINDTYLFTGDAVKLENQKMLVHPYTMNEENAKAAIDKLYERSTDAEYIITAHYGYMRTADLMK